MMQYTESKFITVCTWLFGSVALSNQSINQSNMRLVMLPRQF